MVTPDDVLDIFRENQIKIDIDKLDHSDPLPDQGLDSLDIITVLFAIEERYNIKIPEKDIDQGKLSSIHSIVKYLNSEVH